MQDPDSQNPGRHPASPDSSPAALVDRWWKAKQQLKAAKAEVDALEAQVIELGRGKHLGTIPGAEVTVVAATPGGITYRLEADEEEDARKISGDAFGKLFDRVISYRPCEAFAAVVPKLLPKGAASKLLALCGKATTPKKAHLRS